MVRRSAARASHRPRQSLATDRARDIASAEQPPKELPPRREIIGRGGTGNRLAQFELLDRLGEGGMDVIYKASDSRRDRFVASSCCPNRCSPMPLEKRVRS